jgi:hypothetical protein
LLGALQALASDDGLPRPNFERVILPIFAEHCFPCHGPDGNKRKAHLRLDIQEANRERPIIIPGKPDQSELIRRIFTDNEEDRMPPVGAPKSLTTSQRELIRGWVAAGAVRGKAHWAYQAPIRPIPPAIPPGARGCNPIDAFVGAKLSELGLEPQSEADRRTLLRRISIDLTGLPPTRAEAEAFVRNPSADAYERVVDRLLASPRFGERMAMHWLDLVRYADSRGYLPDGEQQVTAYREYVIRAFNANTPFDRFSRDQLAGDLLPHATAEQRIASGYNRLLMTTADPVAQIGDYTARYAADRVRNVSAVWLGSTMGCAECHDHKYDPLTQQDFYRLSAFFADIKDIIGAPLDPVGVPRTEHEYEHTQAVAALKSLTAEYLRLSPERAAAQAEWERHQSKWRVFKPIAITARRGGISSTLSQADVRLLPGDGLHNEVSFTFKPGGVSITGIRVEVMTVPSDASKPGGTRADANAKVKRVRLSCGDSEAVWKAFSCAKYREAELVEDGPKPYPTGGWELAAGSRRPQFGILTTREPFVVMPGTEVKLRLEFEDGSRFRLDQIRMMFTCDSELPSFLASMPGGPRVVAILNSPAERRTAADLNALAELFREQTPMLAAVRASIEQAKRKIQAIESQGYQTLVTQPTKPRDVRVLPRGNWMSNEGEVVQPGIPSVLGAQSSTASKATRFELAAWLSSAENPLVARVAVNRLWRLMFGRGIVSTMEDFGTRGAPPTHPELLDWMACEFVASGWDTKHILRLIALSETYRRSSEETTDLRRRDPENLWLARQGRFRFDAETVRDAALAASGLLVEQVGGASGRPYQPSNYWESLVIQNDMKPNWHESTDSGQYRRGVYTHWRRAALHPGLVAFDAPSREECVSERPRSNTPQQALVLLNDPTYVEAARVFASRALTEGGSADEDRVAFVWLCALGRSPTQDERAVIHRFLQEQLRLYSRDPSAAEALCAVGMAPRSSGIPRPQLAAWTMVVRAVLNLHESITRF